MKAALKILFAEDSFLDYEVAMQLLNREMKVDSVLVETANDFSRQLEAFNPDLVISDYSMPQFNGMQALEIARNFDPLLPFIIFTGSRNEEIAVDCMRKGASDYVIKENMKRLPFAVMEAYRKSEDMRDNESLQAQMRANEERYRIITESSRDVIFILDLELNYEFVSPAVFYLNGYSVEETMQQHLAEILPPHSQKYVKKVLQEELANELAGKNPKDHARKIQFQEFNRKGELIWVESFVRFLHDERGKPKGIFGISRDITEQKALTQKISESESFLNFAQEIASMGSWEYDIKTGQVYWSENNYRIMGLEPFSIEPDIDYFYSRVLPEDLPMVKQTMKTLIEKDEKISYEFRILMPDKSIRWLQNEVVPIFEQGKLIAIKGVNLDITNRKKEQQALIDSDLMLKLSLEASNQGLYDHNLETDEVVVNDTYARMLGYDPETFVESKQELIERIHPDDKARVLQVYNDYIEGKIDEYRTEFRKKTKDGSWKWILSLGKIINREDDERPSRMLGSHIDIDVNKQNEQQLIESEERFKRIFENAPIGLLMFNEQAIIESCNTHFAQIIGSPVEKLVNLDMNKLKDKKLIGVIEQVLAGERTAYKGQYKATTSEKQSDVEALFAPLFNTKGKVIGGVGIVEDVTERKMARQRLVESEERYSRIFYSSPVAKAILKVDGLEFKEVNDAFCRFTGYSSDMLVGKNMEALGLVKPNHFGFILEQIKALKTISQLEVSVISRNGEPRTGLVSVDYYTYDEETFLIVAVLDITERMQTEEELLKLTRAVEQSPVSIVITNLEGTIEYVNPWVTEVTGYLPGELIGQNPRVMSSKEKPGEEYNELYETLKRGEIWRGEFHNKKKDGSLFWEKATIAPVINDEGVLTHYLAVKEDITLMKQLSESLRQSESRYKNLFRNNPLPMWIYDLETLAFMEVNDAAILKYGYSQDEFKSMTLRDIRPAEDVPLLEENIRSTETSYQTSNNWRHLTKAGELINVEIISHAIPATDGSKLRLVLVNDITEKLIAENTLIKAKAMAEASDRLKTSFLNNISHEVRTPLNGIMGAASLLDDSASGDSEYSELVGIINESSDRLIQTITDFMDISLLTSENMEVYLSNFDFDEVFAEYTRKFENQIGQKNIEYEIVIPENGEPVNLNTDKELLSKAFSHLLSNALKFTKQGKITAGYAVKDNVLEIFVRDTGVGIAKENFEKIFERFTQEDQSSVRRFEGSGLGLTIVMGIMKLIGGNVSLVSDEGVGSCFTLHLPLSMEDTIAIPPVETFSSSGKPVVLIAEDEDANYFVFEMLMRQMAVEKVIRAETGKEAVRLCREFPEISLILMDIKMPEMDGLEATKIIKAERPELPIIAITAYAMSGDEHNIREAGCDDYVAKPVSVKLLKEKLKKFGIETKVKTN
jgi:PAS domain S-box-containing protein